MRHQKGTEIWLLFSTVCKRLSFRNCKRECRVKKETERSRHRHHRNTHPKKLTASICPSWQQSAAAHIHPFSCLPPHHGNQFHPQHCQDEHQHPNLMRMHVASDKRAGTKVPWHEEEAACVANVRCKDHSRRGVVVGTGSS